MNRITVLTSTSLEKLASGVRSNFAGTGLFERIISSGPLGNLHLLYSGDDTLTDPLILIQNQDGDTPLPWTLHRHDRQANYLRILSFAQRTRSLPIIIPKSWRPYRHDNLIGFFSSSTGPNETGRWIGEVRLNGTLDVGLWALTTSHDKQSLQDFSPPVGGHSAARSAWEASFAQSKIALLGPPPSDNTVGVEVVLDAPIVHSDDFDPRRMPQWLPELTERQREFVEAPSDRSIRLRGPAGSGKTLTMAIKAVREAQRAKELNLPTRILFTTHSWSLAGEIDSLITTLSEYGQLDNITVLPLVSVAQEFLPTGMSLQGLELVGDDSHTGKALQLAQIREVLSEFKDTDWITYTGSTSPDFRLRVDSEEEDVLKNFAWDLLIEFGCVLGADGIFPSINAETRYLRLPRAPWMMNLDYDGDKRVVYALYDRFMRSLQARNLVTSDQLLNDFLNYLETYAWNHRRQTEGFDLIFVDEFHLFNIQERQTLRYLSNDTGVFPRIFMALDPRQSPYETHSDSGLDDPLGSDDGQNGSVRTVDIPTVHRSTPQILELVKHIHFDFPNLDLGSDWDLPIGEVESMAADGPRPSLFVSSSLEGEGIEIYKQIREIYPSGNQFAVAVINEDLFPYYMRLMETVAESGQFKVVPISGRDDVGVLKKQKRGVVVGPAEYLAGLQFDTVLIAGLPDMDTSFANLTYRRRRSLSLLYLALTRASRDVRIFANDEETGGIPGLLEKANEEGSLGIFKTGISK